MPFHFANVLIFSGLAIFFVLGSLLAGRLLRPHYPTAEKSMIYECGEKPIGHAWYNFNPRFYLIALVFVVFEVEIAFMFPVASVYKWFLDRGQGLLAFAEIFVFVAILMLGLVYVWVKKDLEWIRSIKGDPRGVPNVVSRTAPALPPVPIGAAAVGARAASQEG